MKYILIRRNKCIVAVNHVSFVNKMRKTDREKWDNNQDFMVEYAHRKLKFENIQLSSENEEKFTNDLQKTNLLKIESSSFLSKLFKKTS